MLDSIEELVSCFLGRFVPSRRFIRLQADTIDKAHAVERYLNPRSIRVLSWNIAKNNHSSRWIKDLLMILERFNPDIICLQEVRFGVDADHAVDLAHMSWSFAPNFMDAHYQFYAGVLTAAKTNSFTRQALITEHYEPLLQTPKVSLITEYPLPHSPQTLLTINSHLINFVKLEKFRVQLQELERTIAGHSGPIIFAGDFNTWSESRVVLLHQVAQRLRLVPVGFPPDEHRNIKRFLLSPPLDYIFYRGMAEKPATAKVLDYVDSSDHKPLLAEFFILADDHGYSKRYSHPV